ncbi:unnamed protein product [Menidia menidia]|uniref:(Atlantic silverside) hypothetical protein n=1 Tax=Menidia menidia TaxID=238744 RepID=A0A8S4BHN0_9TELE|nr:unnamed protein product [Menidia menidia]CAG5986588.1 unnamed protein product [Menidia menidia]
MPTIEELWEEEGDLLDLVHSMQEYLDSMRELSQPACYPLHGPLRGSRRRRYRPGATPPAGGAWPPRDPAQVLLTLRDPPGCQPLPPPRRTHNLLDMLVSQSLFAGLVCSSAAGLKQNRVPDVPVQLEEEFQMFLQAGRRVPDVPMQLEAELETEFQMFLCSWKQSSRYFCEAGSGIPDVSVQLEAVWSGQTGGVEAASSQQGAPTATESHFKAADQSPGG